MNVAEGIGPSQRVAVYRVPDDQLAVGSTLGGPRVTTIVKANGSIEKVYSPDMGEMVFGTMILRHYDAVTGMWLAQDKTGAFVIHPEHQEHTFTLTNGVHARETIFALSTSPQGGKTVDPPAVYQMVELRNDGPERVGVVTYAFLVLRGETGQDVVATYDEKVNAIVAWNESKPDQTRIFGCSEKPESFETTLDYAKAVSEQCPGPLRGETEAPEDPLGALQHTHWLESGESVAFYYLLSFGNGQKEARKNYEACPQAQAGLDATKHHYHTMLSRSVVVTPDVEVNRGVLWAKANMLRIETRAPTGWCFVNDPTRSNNSVGRDTAWFGFGGDYVTPDFVRDALLAYVHRQEKNGMLVEYYDIRNGKTEDYGLNINDDTPLLVMALWHHYTTTGDEDFLREVYPCALKAARYMLSQRNEQGLVWCTATGTQDWGICSWRNVIPNYRLSGAVTEVNSECFSAINTVSHMARVLERHEESAELANEAAALKEAINKHLWNPDNDLYYLHIDIDGHPRSDVTSDLVFPVIFGVAPERTAASIISRLSNEDFWTEAGIRTTPRDAPMYSPNLGWGLIGGVWVGVSFWYAFAAAKHSPAFMAHALSTSFRTYSRDPRHHNTVPGQFSEWLHGETLVNEGMMLSPWFPPRYLWAAIEGMAGFDMSGGTVRVSPRIPPDWKWLGVQNLLYRKQGLTWFTVRMRETTRTYTNFHFPGDNSPYVAYEEDITDRIHVTGDSICPIGLRQGANYILFAGNTADRSVTTSLRLEGDVDGFYRLRCYSSLLDEWIENDELVSADQLTRGTAVRLERKGFCLVDLEQRV